MYRVGGGKVEKTAEKLKANKRKSTFGTGTGKAKKGPEEVDPRKYVWS